MRPALPLTLALLALAACGPCGQTAVPLAGAPAERAPTPSPPEGARFGDPDLPGVDRVDPALEARLRAAFQAMPEDKRPRTPHHRPDGAPRYVNRLLLTHSPYLLQHALNPVNWMPWGEEAFARAQATGRPIFLSVGYSTCHWCHVMARESFEDPEVAAYINAHFVPVKVDREARPDVDAVYMSAVQAFSGRGGWPMTVLLTPDGEPFFGGTYFPPHGRAGRPGLLELLEQAVQLYQADPARVQARAKALVDAVRRAARPAPGDGLPAPEILHRSAAHFAARFDPVYGGFGRAPKFPRPAALDFLLRYAAHTKDPEARRMVIETLEHLSRGGIHDQVGGGFHRYSVTRDWNLPHFEKMLYDNALLVSVYLAAYRASGREDFAAVARTTLGYLEREMRDAGGAYYAATDADSPTPEGREEEGRFFTWTPEEIEAVLGTEAARVVIACYGIGDHGPVDGRSVLALRRPLSDCASEVGLGTEAARQRLEAAKARLYAARAKRPPPHRDEKILLGWNALAASAFAQAGLTLEAPHFVQRAEEIVRFLDTRLRDGSGRPLHAWHEGHASGPAYLDDLAYLTAARLDLYEATGQVGHLEAAIALQADLDHGYWDATDGGYFLTPSGADSPLARTKPFYDGALPSGNAVAAQNLLRLHTLTQDRRYRERAEALLSALAPKMGPATPALLSAAMWIYGQPKEVAIVGAGAPAPQLERTVAEAPVPERVLVVAGAQPPPALLARVPWLERKGPGRAGATAYVCEAGRCELPTSDPAVLRRQLLRLAPLFPTPPPPLEPAARP
ncbi:MAG: thioredoxin domain-containing protein [Deltaproteobacteria bacterium]|nr:MAG: thioredoxin domain-containing protein [Deltaproteobacteria bacterium]